jgi:hypothetical protein
MFKGVVIVAAVLILIVVGGTGLYWIADGQPGTPSEFRERVGEVGLDIEWANNGPRAGEGTVETDCGQSHVAIDEIDGVMWIRWDGKRDLLTADTIEAVLRCR